MPFRVTGLAIFKNGIVLAISFFSSVKRAPFSFSVPNYETNSQKPQQQMLANISQSPRIWGQL